MPKPMKRDDTRRDEDPRDRRRPRGAMGPERLAEERSSRFRGRRPAESAAPPEREDPLLGREEETPPAPLSDRGSPNRDVDYDDETREYERLARGRDRSYPGPEDENFLKDPADSRTPEELTNPALETRQTRGSRANERDEEGRRLAGGTRTSRGRTPASTSSKRKNPRRR